MKAFLAFRGLFVRFFFSRWCKLFMYSTPYLFLSFTNMLDGNNTTKSWELKPYMCVYVCFYHVFWLHHKCHITVLFKKWLSVVFLFYDEALICFCYRLCHRRFFWVRITVFMKRVVLTLRNCNLSLNWSDRIRNFGSSKSIKHYRIIKCNNPRKIKSFWFLKLYFVTVFLRWCMEIIWCFNVLIGAVYRPSSCSADVGDELLTQNRKRMNLRYKRADRRWKRSWVFCVHGLQDCICSRAIDLINVLRPRWTHLDI